MSSSQPSSESHFASDERRTSQQEQPGELRKGKEPQGCFTPEAEGPLPSNSKLTAESHDKEMSQHGQPKERQRWISEDVWKDLVKKSYDYPVRWPSVVSIFRVPNFLKESKKEAYDPKRVSLGPYHHTRQEFSPMNLHKGKALCRMKKRFNNVRNLPDDPNNIEFCYSAVKEIEKLDKAIRHSYEETIECDGNTLALMLSLDGAFILEILRTLGGDELVEPYQASKCYEPIFEFDKIDNTGLDILNDILKLENQIPFIVLQKLLQLELNSDENARKKLLEVLEGYPWPRICPFTIEKKQFSEQCWQPEEACRLLGFLHSLIVSRPQDQDQINVRIKCGCPGCITLHREKVLEENEDEVAEGEDKDIHQIRCYIKGCSAGCIMLHKNKNEDMSDQNDLPRAIELRDAGIKFELCSISQIKFDKVRATIYLPRISISDHTEVVFRNLIAFEMCRPFETNDVADYVYLMDRLIDSEEDVSFLKRMGIVENLLGSDKEVAELFNGLCKGVTVTDPNHIFHGLIRKVNLHYRNKSKVQFAEFVEKSFSSPWKTFAVVGAVFGLLLSVAQTIILIISLRKL